MKTIRKRGDGRGWTPGSRGEWFSVFGFRFSDRMDFPGAEFGRLSFKGLRSHLPVSENRKLRTENHKSLSVRLWRVRLRRPGLRGYAPAQATQLTETRSGLTLFEVLISLVIFVGAMAAIGQLVSNGVRGALQSRYQTEAAMLCEAKLAEVVAGIVPLQSGQGVYPDDSHWSWALIVTVGPVPGLMRAEVTVKRQAVNSKAGVAFNMARYVRDPQLYYAAEEEAERNAAEQEESTTK